MWVYTIVAIAGGVFAWFIFDALREMFDWDDE